ncbi:MAG: hypothetical protein ACYCU5_14950 [Actinomycetes bacterium]
MAPPASPLVAHTVGSALVRPDAPECERAWLPVVESPEVALTMAASCSRASPDAPPAPLLPLVAEASLRPARPEPPVPTPTVVPD